MQYFTIFCIIFKGRFKDTLKYFSVTNHPFLPLQKLVIRSYYNPLLQRQKWETIN